MWVTSPACLPAWHLPGAKNVLMEFFMRSFTPVALRAAFTMLVCVGSAEKETAVIQQVRVARFRC